MVPETAEAYYQTQSDRNARTLTAVNRLWGSMGSDFDASWAEIQPRLSGVVSATQEANAVEATGYIPDVLDETGQGNAVDSVAHVNPRALVGVNGDGRPVGEALYGAVIRTKATIATGATVAVALKAGGEWLQTATMTALSDSARGAERVSMATRPVGGYVRMLVGHSCSRCVILAGRRYASATPFQRHPKCDCRHIPATESVAEDITVNPAEFFESLSTEQQNKTFTKAGAEAIRNGADINQVVNARRGMYTTADGTSFTREGITRRGLYGSAQYRAGTFRRKRFTPEQIQKVATNKDHYLKLLRLYGYIF